MAIHRNPKVALCYDYRGWVYEQKGENDKAIADFIEAIRLDPNDAYALKGRERLQIAPSSEPGSGSVWRIR